MRLLILWMLRNSHLLPYVRKSIAVRKLAHLPIDVLVSDVPTFGKSCYCTYPVHNALPPTRSCAAAITVNFYSIRMAFPCFTLQDGRSTSIIQFGKRGSDLSHQTHE